MSQAGSAPVSENKPSAAETFATQQEVLAYLVKSGGYKIGKSALSNHVRERRLTKKKGVFSRKDVDSYALHLQSAATGQAEADKKTTELQNRKLTAEICRTEEQALKAKIEREALEGKYILRANLELELASRAVVFDAGLRAMIQGQVPAWIELVEGDQAKTPDMIEAMIVSVGRLLSDYASTSRFQVVFKGEED
ncbi:MAG: hypothetical protein WCZ86_03920 [Desulfurivibrionaceae bacterium]|jgi:hypothetical protein